MLYYRFSSRKVRPGEEEVSSSLTGHESRSSWDSISIGNEKKVPFFSTHLRNVSPDMNEPKNTRMRRMSKPPAYPGTEDNSNIAQDDNNDSSVTDAEGKREPVSRGLIPAVRRGSNMSVVDT